MRVTKAQSGGSYLSEDAAWASEGDRILERIRFKCVIYEAVIREI